ncbi:efflux transporter outer membrane subunit [Acidisoma cladoniae]|jgi:NodT family efflux transporter outer membrane factor (OMF) lipoprotein|uniref:efflux transporter outer membrane subunit n=1 Tax=Acidisoma cladoniae TaxID=3040935 RepID=UPI00254E28EE|nr:efflux transporter outer membrane subunit [Acidisoma sp. PAMC 29798]
MNVARSWICLVLLAGCTVGPDYHRPSAPTSSVYKELLGWTPAHPSDDINRGTWWRIYDDPLLDQLEGEIDVGNQNLRAYEAAYREARATVDEARANYFPTLSATASGEREQASGLASTTKTGEGTLSWDVDLWGKVRRQVESDTASAQASVAELASIRLSAQADLATDYFELRYQDSLTQLLSDTVRAYQRSLTITQNQYTAGVAARSDVITAQTQLQTTEASLVGTGVLRVQYEHAVALLIGKPPAELSIPTGLLTTTVPVVPVEVPAVLLQRRPDIAEVERKMQQQNALIGVETAAFYPDISLSAALGSSGAAGGLFSVSNELWSIAASGTETLFEGGARSAAVDAALATYDQAVANYRETVLAAFQDVEDELSGQRILANEATTEAAAVASARDAVRIALNEYRAGTETYTTVVTAQATALSDEESALEVMESRMTTNVSLVRALGGGWTSRMFSSLYQNGSLDGSSR